MDRPARRERELAEEATALRERFLDRGVEALDAVPAFSGMYPYYGGFGNWEYLLTQWRVLARTRAGIEVWSAWTGPTPRKRLQTCSPEQFLILSMGRRILGRRRYDRVSVGPRKFWVHRSYRHELRRWAEHG